MLRVRCDALLDLGIFVPAVLFHGKLRYSAQYRVSLCYHFLVHWTIVCAHYLIDLLPYICLASCESLCVFVSDIACMVHVSLYFVCVCIQGVLDE